QYIPAGPADDDAIILLGYPHHYFGLLVEEVAVGNPAQQRRRSIRRIRRPERDRAEDSLPERRQPALAQRDIRFVDAQVLRAQMEHFAVDILKSQAPGYVFPDIRSAGTELPGDCYGGSGAHPDLQRSAIL